MRRWTRPLPAEPGRAILSNVWTTSTCYKPREIERPCLLWRLRSATYDLVQGHRRVYSVLLEGIGPLVLCDVLQYHPMIVLSWLPHYLARLSTAHPTFTRECNDTT